MSPDTAGRGRMPAWDEPVDEAPASGRPVIGYVYEIVTGDPRDGEHPYVGKTRNTPHQRVHGRSGHTSPASIAKDPWKARILAGRAGYRVLEKVRDTGAGELANDEALRRAESFWIDRLRPTHNEVRPVRPPVHEVSGRPAPRPVRLTEAQIRARLKRRRATRRLVAFVVLAALGTWLVCRVVLAMDLPWGAAPFVAGPAVGTLLGWFAFLHLDRALAYLVGGPAPRRRRRRYR